MELRNSLLDYMRKNGSSEHYLSNLKVAVSFSLFLGKENSFYDIKKGTKFRNS